MRDLRDYEIAILQGKAITETGQKQLDDEAFVLVNGIAGAALEAGKLLTRQAQAIRLKTRDGKDKGRDKGGRGQ